ncbi:Uncharacterised protein [Salmonella enterica subsp. enterica serovar Typhi]|nr:Uncharacterised protein [Salmonella enterica subsp. enterica serovar Typhi]
MLINFEHLPIEFFAQIIQMIPSIFLFDAREHRHHLTAAKTLAILLLCPLKLPWVHWVKNYHCEVLREPGQWVNELASRSNDATLLIFNVLSNPDCRVD